MSLLFFSHSPVNTSDVLTIESETENRFVLEQLWSSGLRHQTVWLGMHFNIDSKNPLVSLYQSNDPSSRQTQVFIKLFPLCF